VAASADSCATRSASFLRPGIASSTARAYAAWPFMNGVHSASLAFSIQR